MCEIYVTKSSRCDYSPISSSGDYAEHSRKDSIEVVERGQNREEGVRRRNDLMCAKL